MSSFFHKISEEFGQKIQEFLENIFTFTRKLKSYEYTQKLF
ncbi:hypothetical protein CCAN11_480001 [Capnocytophaga canimorsus]|uniref:Uncharacterized protein n=1 Tax=Capnocytophaga canimorsus TaxID=28188 RepID=A0A0B7ISS6_9FLAO|nr:hypothetical protein CCAN11_480001 [Capnocytophaga canimorsus]